MKKLLHMLGLTTVFISAIQANAITDIFKSTAEKQMQPMIDSITRTYPTVYRNNTFFTEKVDDIAWNKTLASIETYIKDAKATELNTHFYNLRSVSDTLANTNKIIYNKYKGKINIFAASADLKKLVSPIPDAQNLLRKTKSALLLVKKNEEVKKVLLAVADPLDRTLDGVMRDIANFDKFQKDVEALQKEIKASSSQFQTKTSSTIIESLAKADAKATKTKLDTWNNLFVKTQDLLKRYDAPNDIKNDLETLKKANNAMMSYIGTLVDAQRTGKPVDRMYLANLKSNFERALGDIQPVIARNKKATDNKELRQIIVILGEALDDIMGDLMLDKEWPK